MRSLHMMAAASAMIFLAADKGSGGGKSDAPDLLGDQTDVATQLTAALAGKTELDGKLTVALAENSDLVAKLAAMTAERDDALAAGATAIGELKDEIGKLTDQLAESDKALASARRTIDDLDARLEASGAPAPRRASSLPAEDHYVLQTSKIDGWARGRVITCSTKKAVKWLSAGKIRQATVAEVENARQEIVRL